MWPCPTTASELLPVVAMADADIDLGLAPSAIADWLLLTLHGGNS